MPKTQIVLYAYVEVCKKKKKEVCIWIVKCLFMSILASVVSSRIN